MRVIGSSVQVGFGVRSVQRWKRRRPAVPEDCSLPDCDFVAGSHLTRPAAVADRPLWDTVPDLASPRFMRCGRRALMETHLPIVAVALPDR